LFIVIASQRLIALWAKNSMNLRAASWRGIKWITIRMIR